MAPADEPDLGWRHVDARQLQYFLAVVDEGSVHAAAKRLFVAQPSVSQALRSLERSLGAELFHRVGRRLVLTAAGESLIAPARQVARWLDLAQANVAAVHGLRTGRLVIATMPSQAVAPLPAIIDRFVARFPMVQTSIRAAFTPPDVVAVVRSGGVELGMMACTAPTDTADLVIHSVARQLFVLLAPAGSGLPVGAPLRFEQLNGQRLIIGQAGTGMRRVADQILEKAPAAVPVVETEHREAVLPMVMNGIGVAVVSDAWSSLARALGLEVHALVSEESLEVSVVHRPGDISPAARAFLLITSSSGHRR